MEERMELLNQNKAADRDKEIIKVSIVGILANVLLAGMKATVGLLSHSIAIVMDAVNNMSDAASSVITIVGTKLAGKQPDKKHPFGHGRIEYLSAMVISILVLYAGLTAFIESVKKIIKPQTPDYSVVSLILVASAVVVKIVLGSYVKSKGERLNSDALTNSGEDAMLDSIISAATLVAAGIFLLTGVSLEALLGSIISLVIIKSGIDMLRETISKILGEGADVDMAIAIKKTINSYPQVSGAYDLVIHNYGPNTYNGSVHIEIPDTLSADELDRLIRKITEDVYAKHNIILTAIGVYSVNTKDEEAVKIREDIAKIVFDIEYIIGMHGFYLDKEDKKIRFDVVISFDASDRYEVYRLVCGKVKEAYPDYDFQIAMDMDFSEI